LVGPTEICTDKAIALKPFALEVFKLKFEEEPYYGKLRHILLTAMVKEGQFPDKRFDWSMTPGHN
jgi:hypothetical protein